MARRVRSRSEAVDIELSPPAMNAEDREDQLIALAYDVAEERLRDRTASNQLIAEIMKLGTTKERLQKEKLQRENEMLRVKAKAIEAQKNTEELYAKAIMAMRSYSGFGIPEEIDEFEEDN